MNQRSFVFVKPDGVHRNLVGEIIKRFESAGLTVEALEMINPDDETLNKHYPLDDYNYLLTLGHVDVSNFTEEEKKAKYDKSYKVVEALKKYVKPGPIVKMIIGGKSDTVEQVRKIVGKTDPAASPEGTIRGDLGIDSFAQSDKEERAVENLVHASGTPEEAAREIELWFRKEASI